jgi:hypothetical protein
VKRVATTDADRPSPTEATLPPPAQPLGPSALGIRVSAAVEADGWTWWTLEAPLGLDGPPSVLQGGLVTAIPVALARGLDPHGAPLCAVTARLEAPTPLATRFVARARPGTEAGISEVETWAGGVRLATTRVELTGHAPLHQLADLVALAELPPPPPEPDPIYATCFGCGVDATHPAALRAYPAWIDPQRLSIPWVASKELASPGRVTADGAPLLDELLVAAVLDCPTAWVSLASARSGGHVGVVLGTLHLRIAEDAAVLDPVRITAQLDAVEGRRLRSRSAMIDSDGRVLASVEAVNIAVRELPDPVGR